MCSLADEYNAVHYEEDEVTEGILEMVEEKVDDLFYSLEEIENLKVYKYSIQNNTEPQTVLKIYKITKIHHDWYRELVAIIDVEITENNVSFTWYNITENSASSAEFINGEMGMVDGIPTPIQEHEFNTRDIENLLDNIYSEFCN